MTNQLNIFEKLAEYFRPPAPSFFNTINEKGQELLQSKAQTGLQDRRVLDIFRELGKLTPLEVSRAYNSRYPPAPATSIRRSITVLTGLKMLQKLNETKIEVYGKKNYLWQKV